MVIPESPDERDRRIADLWESLGVSKSGRLDLNGLKKGLKKIDHREFGRPPLSPHPSRNPLPFPSSPSVTRSRGDGAVN